MAQTLDQLVIELKADIRGLQASLNTADGNLRKFGSRAEQEASRIDAAFARAGKAIAGYFTAQALFNFSRAAVDTAIRMESLQAKMVAATGSSDAATSSMAFLRAESERLGMNFMSAADGFGSFAAAATRAGISMTDVKQVFQGVSEAATALQLSPERVSLTFMALSQIAAKGVVSMEELRQQLGEQLPIAFDAAARAMGVSQARLVEMVSKGEVTAQEFLPKFGRAIRENLGDAVAKASQTALAQTNRLTNAINDLQVKMAGGKAMESYTSAVKNLASAVGDPDVQEGLAAIASGIGYITEIAVVGIATIARWAATLVSEVGKAEAHVRASGYSDRPSMQGLGMAGRRTSSRLGSGPMNSGGGELSSAEGLLAALGGAPLTGGGPSGGKTGGGGRGRDEAGMLRNRVETLKYYLASETEQLAMEYEKQQELLREALEKKAITEQEYRDLKLEAEVDYKNRFGELWAEEAQERVRLEEEAQNAILGNRRNMYGALTGLMSQFGGKSKAFAIAAIAIEKAQAMQSVLIESRKSAMAARAWAMAMGGPAAAEAAFAREIMMGQVTAAMIAATGLAQAFGGGGGGGDASDGGGSGDSSGVVGSTAGGVDSPARAQSKNIFINIEGDYFSAEHARRLVNSLNEFMGDGSIKLNVTEARYA